MSLPKNESSDLDRLTLRKISCSSWSIPSDSSMSIAYSLASIINIQLLTFKYIQSSTHSNYPHFIGFSPIFTLIPTTEVGNLQYIKSMLQLLHVVPSFSIKSNYVLMELEQRLSVWHCEQRYLQLPCLVVQLCLHIDAHRACALVQDCEQGLVVEKPCHRDSLLLSARQNIVPVVYGVKSSFSVDYVSQLNRM